MQLQLCELFDRVHMEQVSFSSACACQGPPMLSTTAPAVAYAVCCASGKLSLVYIYVHYFTPPECGASARMLYIVKHIYSVRAIHMF